MSRGEQVDPVVSRSSRLPTAITRERKSGLPYGKTHSLAKPASSPRYSITLCSGWMWMWDRVFVKAVLTGYFWKPVWQRKVCGLMSLSSWTGKWVIFSLLLEYRTLLVCCLFFCSLLDIMDWWSLMVDSVVIDYYEMLSNAYIRFIHRGKIFVIICVKFIWPVFISMYLVLWAFLSCSHSKIFSCH